MCLGILCQQKPLSFFFDGHGSLKISVETINDYLFNSLDSPEITTLRNAFQLTSLFDCLIDVAT